MQCHPGGDSYWLGGRFTLYPSLKPTAATPWKQAGCHLMWLFIQTGKLSKWQTCVQKQSSKYDPTTYVFSSNSRMTRRFLTLNLKTNGSHEDWTKVKNIGQSHPSRVRWGSRGCTGWKLTHPGLLKHSRTQQGLFLMILLMDKILHHQGWWLSHYL